METLPTFEYYLEKHRASDVLSLVGRKLLIHKQLEQPARSYVVYSDLHGSFEKYMHWLRGGLGYYKIAVSEILGPYYDEKICALYEKLLLIVNRSRMDAVEKHIESNDLSFTERDLFFEPIPSEFVAALDHFAEYGLSKRRVLEDLLRLIRGITRGDERRIIKAVPSEHLENFLKLYSIDEPATYEALIEGITSSSQVYRLMSSLLVKLLLINMFDKHINLGDTFDRGDAADKLIKLYRTYFSESANATPLHYIWGNHDILWMGAALGNPILCMTALRISLRYNNLAFLQRYGFDLERLKAFALETYAEPPTGAYTKARDYSSISADDAARMAKVLLVLEEKLTVSCLEMATRIEGKIDYGQELGRHRELLKILPKGVGSKAEDWEKFKRDHPLYTDVYFPTISSQDPHELTDGEKTLVDDLVAQFTSLANFQEDMKWLFWKGETYRVVDNTLYFHAAIPSTEDLNLSALKDVQGKHLFDFVQRDLKRLGAKHSNGDEITLREHMLLWYLWCGERSVFFCKSKMATLERAVFDKEEAAKSDLTTWREISNPFYKNIRNDHFLSKVLQEFHAKKLCMGHTPVRDVNKAILSDVHRAFMVDGGASEAYGDRGSILIHTPEKIYLTMHPPLEELRKAEQEDRIPHPVISPLTERGNETIRHLDKGYFLEAELRAIDKILDEEFDGFEREYYSRMP